jgi:hypothetical protein
MEPIPVKREGEDEHESEEQDHLMYDHTPSSRTRLGRRMPSVQTLLASVVLLGVSLYIVRTLARLDSQCNVALQHADVALESLADASTSTTVPLMRAHSHNDYVQSQPLLTALGAGFCSIEVDVFFENGKLFVGHTVASEHTMQDLYLKPLRERIDANGGSVYPRSNLLGLCTQVQLVVDMKTPDSTTWDAIEKALTEELGPGNGGYLNCDLEKRTAAGADHLDELPPLSPLTVLVSGVEAKEIPSLSGHILNKANRCSSLDGRRGVNKSPSVTRALTSVQTMVSEDFSLFIGVNGEVDEGKLRNFVSQTREHGFRSRIWGVASSVNLWQLAIDAGVDVISVDDILLFKHFMLGQ